MSRNSQGPTVYLHIGTPKSGTTYLQSRFSVNHERAVAQGMLWPGPSWGRHVNAVRDLRRLEKGETLPAGGAWDKLAREATGWGGDSVLISMEWMASLTPYQLRAALESLEPARVEVILTVRDLLRSFVAQGQEMSKNYRTWTWAQLVEEVRGETDGPASRTFWRQQDVPAILRRWLEVVPGDRVHVVTIPPAGADPGVLWERFCSVVGIDGSDFELPPSDNASLGVVSTTLMQRLNTVAADRGLSHPVYKKVIHKAVGVDILGPRRKQEEPIALSEDMDAFLRVRSEQMVADLRTLDVDLVGEWEDLVPSKPLTGRRPEDVTDSELLALCMEALVTLGVSTTEEIDDLRRQLGRPDPDEEADAGRAPGVKRALRRARGAARRTLGETRGQR